MRLDGYGTRLENGRTITYLDVTSLRPIVERFSDALRDFDEFAALLLRPASLERDMDVLLVLGILDVEVSAPSPSLQTVQDPSPVYRLCSTCGCLRTEIRATRPTTCATCHGEDHR